ncbi:MAG: MFS transporter [Bacteroidia bacterium]
MREAIQLSSFENSKAKSNQYLWMLFAICFLSGVFGGTVSALMSVYLPVAVKTLLGDTDQSQLEQVSAYINSIFIFGWMFGGFAWGVLCDRFGRKKSIILSTACYGLFTLTTAIAPTWMWVVVSRFFSGFGVGGVLVTTAIMISEVWSEKNKAIALGILSITIPVGIFSAGLIDYFISDWRQAFYIGIIPVLLAIISIGTLKESEKWNIYKSSSFEENENNSSLMSLDIRKDLITGCIIFGSMLIGLWAVFAWLPTWVQSLMQNENGQKQRGISMMIFASGGLTGGFISGWITNAIGMRKTMMACFAGCFILCFILFKLNSSITALAYVEMALIALFFGISQGVLTVYIPELFPTPVRASATGFCFNVGRLFTATVVFFVGSLVSLLGGYGNAIFIFSFVFVAGFIATLYASEKNVVES